MVAVLLIVIWRVVFLNRKFDLWPFDGKTIRAIAVIFLVACGLWALPHFGTPLLDIAVRSALLTVVYWPLVHVLGIAPELGAQVAKLTRHFRQLIPGA